MSEELILLIFEQKSKLRHCLGTVCLRQALYYLLRPVYIAVINKQSVRNIDSAINHASSLGRKGQALCREKLVPGAKVGSRVVKNEILKIHRKQNLFEKTRKTFISKGIGLFLGMISAKIVGQFVEVKSASNLWGLFSTNTMVSQNDFIAISFGVEFSVALIVFTLTEHYLDELKHWRKRGREQAAVTEASHSAPVRSGLIEE